MKNDEARHTGLIDEVALELGELRKAGDQLDEAVALQFGLNRTDLRCLGILYRRGRVTAGELAEESGLTPGAITTVLDRLERGGYANRVRGSRGQAPRPRRLHDRDARDRRPHPGRGGARDAARCWRDVRRRS